MRHTHLVLLLALSACDPTGTITPVEPRDGSESALLTKFNDCNELESHLIDQFVEELVQSRYGLWGGGVVLDGAAEDTDSGTSSEGPSDYTTTNVQEEGVDEADFVKTDGEYLYVLQDGRLFVVSSWPAEEAERVGELAFSGNVYPSAMFLHGDKLLVYASHWDENTYESQVRMMVVDVSTPSSPRVTRTIDVDGWYTSARMVDGQAYAVVGDWLQAPPELWELAWRDDIGLPPDVDWDAPELERLTAQFRARMVLQPLVAALFQDIDLQTLLPGYEIDDGTTTQLHSCADIYAPNTTSAPRLLSVVHLDLESSDPEPAATGLLADGWTVYASQKNLYVAQSSQWWWDWSTSPMVSHIHQFSLDGTDAHPQYEASGIVDGWLLNQFSLSEYDGYLRVASTESDWWWGSTEDDVEDGSLLTVLRKDGASLVEHGKVSGIAPGEVIQASRMLGDTGYMVTFERVDPLFTIDLSDPSQPEIMGELKMPGFSSYLHPLGEDHLLAVGQHGDWDGTLQGIDVTIFDVSDLTDPQIAHQYTFGADGDGWAYSEALWDHKAFTFHRGTLSIPAYEYDWSQDASEMFSGLLVLEIDPDLGITERGRVDHRDLVEESACLYGDKDVCYSEYYWYASMRRSVYVEDHLFSISNYGVKVNDLYAPEVEQARVHFYPQ